MKETTVYGYLLQYKVEGYNWKTFSSYRKLDDPELLKMHKAYSDKALIVARVLEVKKITREVELCGS